MTVVERDQKRKPPLRYGPGHVLALRMSVALITAMVNASTHHPQEKKNAMCAIEPRRGTDVQQRRPPSHAGGQSTNVLSLVTNQTSMLRPFFNGRDNK